MLAISRETARICLVVYKTEMIGGIRPDMKGLHDKASPIFEMDVF